MVDLITGEADATPLLGSAEGEGHDDNAAQDYRVWTWPWTARSKLEGLPRERSRSRNARQMSPIGLLRSAKWPPPPSAPAGFASRCIVRGMLLTRSDRAAVPKRPIDRAHLDVSATACRVRPKGGY